jgi:hypothetical protein
MRRRIVFVPMSMEATFSGEVGPDFTAEFLRDDIGSQFRLKNLKGGPIVEIIGLNGGPGDDSDEQLVRGLVRDGVNREVETVEVFVVIVF